MADQPIRTPVGETESELRCGYCQMPLTDAAQFHTIEYCWAYLHNSGRGQPEEIADRINIGMEYLAYTHPRIEAERAHLLTENRELREERDRYETALREVSYGHHGASAQEIADEALNGGKTNAE